MRNEAENILPLAEEITGVMAKTSWQWECIWVDDASIDETLAALMDLHAQNCHHCFLALKRHQGQSAALWAGFQASRGMLLATLDGDGQNDPADLPQLAELVLSGMADMAHGYRQKRMDPWPRLAASRMANTWRNWIIGKTVRDVGCSTRVFRRECSVLLPIFKGMHRFLPDLIAMHGFQIIEQPVNHRPRLRGSSKYTVNNRLWVGMLDTLGVWCLRIRRFDLSLNNQKDLFISKKTIQHLINGMCRENQENEAED